MSVIATLVATLTLILTAILVDTLTLILIATLSTSEPDPEGLRSW